MAKMLKRAEKDKLLLGALPEDRAKNLEKAVKIRENLMKNVINFGEEMGMEEVQPEEGEDKKQLKFNVTVTPYFTHHHNTLTTRIATLTPPTHTHRL